MVAVDAVNVSMVLEVVVVIPTISMGDDDDDEVASPDIDVVDIFYNNEI